MGEVVGDAIGSVVGKGDNKAVAILIASILGAVIGHKIGHDLDNADRGCLGQVLKLGEDSQRVTWSNPDNGLNYTVTSLSCFSAGGNKCRNYRFGVRGDGINESRNEKTCLASDGAWRPYKS